MRVTRIIAAALMIAGSGLSLDHSSAQQQQVQRTDLLQSDISIAGREVSQVRVDFEPGAVSIKHSHPGEEVAYVIEGSLEYQLEGRQPVTLKAGETLFIPAGTVHLAKNVSNGKSSELATYILEKGKPTVVPAK
ncbi:cupin domain-containing protein [Phyllobacterium endophyticum]|uniref:cupin domain-containing protein n=1 Tax=Phyllobacterium endophyticum TaxID=1149773 RepID=UPI0011CB382B|nr:cupin domain-containing protein [Phyllobacterium endophyticum]TXR48172.1 cupin domain-containing protein [Phyllobacterium endophyticum]